MRDVNACARWHGENLSQNKVRTIAVVVVESKEIHVLLHSCTSHVDILTEQVAILIVTKITTCIISFLKI